MDCMQLRSPPGPFHYLISEQAKSLVALQELQNEVGALLEFRDLVIETFPNLRSKMAPSTPASGTRRDWEPGVRVRRKLAAAGDGARAKPQPSVQDSGFSTETSCGKDAHSSASASAHASRSRPLEDELWALLDVIQRKGLRLRDEAELLRGEIDDRPSSAGDTADTAEDSFARALTEPLCAQCADTRRLRAERDALLARAAQLEAAAAAAASPASPPAPRTPLGRLDGALCTPPRPPRVQTPDSKKFAAILHESNPVELQRQLLTSTVQNQLLCDKLRRAAAQRTVLLQKLEQTRDLNDDLRFRLEEKNIELEGARARVRQLEGGAAVRCASADSLRSRTHSMRELQPLPLPDDEARRRPSRIPLHTASKGAAPRPPVPGPAPGPRPASAHSVRSARSAASGRSRASRDASVPAPAPGAARKEPKSGVPVRRSPAAHDNKWWSGGAARESLSTWSSGPSGPGASALAAEYVSRAARLAPLFPRLHRPSSRPLPSDMLLAYESPQNLALELCKSILYENADSLDVKALKSLQSTGDDSLWNNKPQQYFESMKYSERAEPDDDVIRSYDADSLAH